MEYKEQPYEAALPVCTRQGAAGVRAGQVRLTPEEIRQAAASSRRHQRALVVTLHVRTKLPFQVGCGALCLGSRQKPPRMGLQEKFEKQASPQRELRT